MTTRLNAFEILTVAETIERDSIDFYRKAARLFKDEALRTTLLLLADWERKHESVFAAMKKELSHNREKDMTFDVSSFLLTSPLTLKCMAWSAIQSKSKREFTGAESKEEILELAMSRERNVISFYYNHVEIVGDSLGKDNINEVIGEEKRHVCILRRALEQLRDPQSACRS